MQVERWRVFWRGPHNAHVCRRRILILLTRTFWFVSEIGALSEPAIGNLEIAISRSRSYILHPERFAHFFVWFYCIGVRGRFQRGCGSGGCHDDVHIVCLYWYAYGYVWTDIHMVRIGGEFQVISALFIDRFEKTNVPERIQRDFGLIQHSLFIDAFRDLCTKLRRHVVHIRAVTCV